MLSIGPAWRSSARFASSALRPASAISLISRSCRLCVRRSISACSLARWCAAVAWAANAADSAHSLALELVSACAGRSIADGRSALHPLKQFGMCAP